MRMRRISVNIPEDLAQELDEAVPYGFRRHFIAAILQILLTAVRKHGVMVIGAAVDGEFTLDVKKSK